MGSAKGYNFILTLTKLAHILIVADTGKFFLKDIFFFDLFKKVCDIVSKILCKNKFSMPFCLHRIFDFVISIDLF